MRITNEQLRAAATSRKEYRALRRVLKRDARYSADRCAAALLRYRADALQAARAPDRRA